LFLNSRRGFYERRDLRRAIIDHRRLKVGWG
jgi:hypothetical protein